LNFHFNSIFSLYIGSAKSSGFGSMLDKSFGKKNKKTRNTISMSTSPTSVDDEADYFSDD
jgi:hypothetical protein